MSIQTGGGAVQGREGLHVIETQPLRKRVPCKLALRPVLLSSGDVGFCPCSDYDAKMKIGSLKEESLKSIVTGKRRLFYLESFFDGSEHPHCKKCTFYKPFDGRGY